MQCLESCGVRLLRDVRVGRVQIVFQIRNAGGLRRNIFTLLGYSILERRQCGGVGVDFDTICHIDDIEIIKATTPGCQTVTQRNRELGCLRGLPATGNQRPVGTDRPAIVRSLKHRLTSGVADPQLVVTCSVISGRSEILNPYPDFIGSPLNKRDVLPRSHIPRINLQRPRPAMRNGNLHHTGRG